MKTNKKIIILLISFCLACFAVYYFGFFGDHGDPQYNCNSLDCGASDKMITSFQDSSGWFYTCSKPVQSKWAVIPHLNGKSRRQLVAANPEDVKLYCHRNGIE